jgi:hypothetical protein
VGVCVETGGQGRETHSTTPHPVAVSTPLQHWEVFGCAPGKPPLPQTHLSLSLPLLTHLTPSSTPPTQQGNALGVLAALCGWLEAWAATA